MRDALRLAVDELAHERKLEVVRHHVRRALDLALLHEELELGHDLVLELLEPLVELHVVLVRARVVVLAATGLAPVGLCFLEGVLDLVVEDAVPLGGLAVEFDGEDARLDAELEDAATVRVGRTEGALGALIASGRASGDIA